MADCTVLTQSLINFCSLHTQGTVGYNPPSPSPLSCPHAHAAPPTSGSVGWCASPGLAGEQPPSRPHRQQLLPHLHFFPAVEPSRTDWMKGIGVLTVRKYLRKISFKKEKISYNSDWRCLGSESVSKDILGWKNLHYWDSVHIFI